MSQKRIVVGGGGGFIGGHLAQRFLDAGHQVRIADIKPLDEWYQVHDDAENFQLDLKDRDSCTKAVEGCHEIYQLAADMGGMGFIENNKTLCMLSVLTSTHMLMAAQKAGCCERFFFSSSACVYNASKQTDPNVCSLKEADAYPADASLLNDSVVITAKTLIFRHASLGSTTSTAPTEHGMVVERRRQQQSVARSSTPRPKACTRSKSGAMVPKRGVSCTSMIAPRAST
jgi:hypothetical protein